MQDLGARLRQLRTRRKMTQDQLAQALFVTRQTISNYENGKSEPDLETLKKLGTILETDLGTLLGGPPASERRGGSRRALAISAAVTAGMLLLLLLAEPWAKAMLQEHSEGAPALMLWQLWRPVTLGLLGRTAMEGVLVLTKPVPVQLVRWSRRILWPLTVPAIAFWLPMFIGELVQSCTGSVTILNRFMPELHAVFLAYHMLLWRWYWSFVLWGAALRLTKKQR